MTYVLEVLIPELEKLATCRSPDHRGMQIPTWRARHHAAVAVTKKHQGGSGPRVHRMSPGRLLGGPSPALRDVLPREFAGRERELEELMAFVMAQQDGPDYLWYQAGSWAGKTALLAWFVDRYQLLAGVDIAHYFISGRLGTDRREDFVRVVGRQLAAAAGSRRLRAKDLEQSHLAPWYEAAAQECRQRGRRLVLIVDGLDEDADVSLDDPGIAGLLPKVPPCGMRVIVTGRPHPRVPVNLAPDHPLRDPAVVRRLADSPAARVIRDTAMAELRTLLNDRDIGQHLLGLLVAAQGALTAADLSELLDIRPYEVQGKLRTVVARSMAPTRTDRLALDIRAEAEAEAGRQAFVLAHSTLHATASEELGRRFLTERTHDLDRWAQQYREEGWPEDTPNYLLTGYTRLLHEKQRTEELTALVLDPQRQLRLAQSSGPDVALAQLDLITSSVRNHSAPLDVAKAAAAAASREMLLAHVQPLPTSVARTIARLGDAQRARALAGASGKAVDKAVNLTAVARVLQAMDDEQAVATAREAGEWARAALREADRLGHAADEAEAAAAQAALALLETARGQGRSRDHQHQHEDGLALLRSTRGTSTTRNEAWVQAALLLASDHPEHAAELLDELEEQAEALAAEDPAEGGLAAGAVQLWQTVASVAPDRADRLHERVLALAAEVWQDAPTLENVSVIAAAASFVAHDRPAQAEQLVATACQHLERTLNADAGLLSAADAFHIEFGFLHTLTALSQAVADVGGPPETAARVLELGRRALPLEPADQPEQSAPDEDEDHAFAEAGAFADQAFRLAESGAVNDAEHHLKQALALLPTAGTGMDRSPAWLPDLAGALIRTDAASKPEPLLELVQHPADRVRVHAAMALAYADSSHPAPARHHAREAARAAVSAATSDTSWAYAAQALACAGEVELSMNLVEQHKRPDRAGGRAAWRKADQAARVAVAAELATHDPEAAGELIDPLLKRLDAARHAIHSEGPLTSLAELLPATAHLSSARQSLFDAVMERAREQVARSSPQSWHPESVLLDAFLRIGAGAEPARQLDWLTRDLANRGARLFPTAALAVLHAALCDTTTAQRVATLPAAPHQKAAALTAVASHLARVPSHPCPVPDSIGTDRFIHAIQHLALKVTSATRPDNEAPVKLLHHALATAGWHQAIPVLAHLAPEAVAAVRDIVTVHLRASHVSRT
ncbi:hypothetical protein ABZ802_33695 [Streptomyces sp. NPDC047737]|uniref:hypothetical protein n=1 Tax=Streptomyces sp. NPDC047737 TaxID=3155740 RepID=UPI0033DA2F2A